MKMWTIPSISVLDISKTAEKACGVSLVGKDKNNQPSDDAVWLPLGTGGWYVYIYDCHS